MTRWKMAVAVLVAIGAFFAGGWLLRKGMTSAPPADSAAVPVPGGTRLFNAVLQTVRSYAVDSLDESSIYKLAASGVLAELGDPYAALVSDRDTAVPPDQLGAKPVLGLYLDWSDGFVGVVSVVPGSPAAVAGARAGDVVLRVGATQISAQRPDEVARLIDEAKDSTVRVRLGRETMPAPLWVTISRGPTPEMPPPSVERPGTGPTIVRIHRIDSAAVRALAGVLDSAAARPRSSLILDLRGAVGGTLADAVAFADLLLAPGQTIVTARGRTGTAATPFLDQRPTPAPELPVVVLVDRGTAGAAEVVAGALQDHDRAALVGETTFGRGARLSFFPLGNGSSLRLTTEVWLTPSGRVIQRFIPPPVPEGSTDTLPDRPKFKTDGGRTVLGGGGVVPDREVPLDAEPSRASDPVLDAARQLLARASDRKALLAAVSAN